MRITLSGAMRARDVSRPTDEQLDAAAEREARITRVGRPSGADAAVGPGRAAAVAAVVAAPNGPGALSAAARTARPASVRDAEGASASVRDAEGSSASVRDAEGSSASVRDGEGTGRNGAGAGERASDEVSSPTRRRRRRRGR